jgi:hypothetical protein
MPVARRDREKALPDARWRTGIRRTQGGAQRQLQAWPLHRRENGDSSVAEGEDPRSEGVDQDASRLAVIAMPEPAFTAEPLRAGLVGDELRLTPRPYARPAKSALKISRRPGPRCDRSKVCLDRRGGVDRSTRVYTPSH